MLSRFHRIPERNLRTDGQTQTDIIAISLSLVSVLTRDKNWIQNGLQVGVVFSINLNLFVHRSFTTFMLQPDCSYWDNKARRSMLGAWTSLHVHDNAAAECGALVSGDLLRLAVASPHFVRALVVVVICSPRWRHTVTQRRPISGRRWRRRFRHTVVTRYQLQCSRVPSEQCTVQTGISPINQNPLASLTSDVHV